MIGGRGEKPGAGKSTFARRLRDKTGIPLYYLDMLWHKPDKTNITREEFDAGLNGIMKNEAWIIDGNYLRTLEVRLQNFDTVFFLDYPLELCLEGARARTGKEREDFRQWILDFLRDQLPEIYELLEKYRDGKEIIVFRTREEADAYMRDMEIQVRSMKVKVLERRRSNESE